MVGNTWYIQRHKGDTAVFSLCVISNCVGNLPGDEKHLGELLKYKFPAPSLGILLQYEWFWA